MDESTTDGQGKNDDDVSLERRDRTKHPYCVGEPRNPDPTFQAILDQAYALIDEHRIEEVYPLLMQHTHLASLPYQETRSEFLFGEYFVAADRELDEQHVPYHERDQNFLGQAADHYARAAAIAWEIPDVALYAQLKALESRACYFSHPRDKRYRRAFEAARRALDAWEQLPDRKIATDMSFGFKLGDLLSVAAGMVGEDGEAVRGMEYAAHRLFELQHRPDADLAQYANDELFLDWDWTYLFYTTGHYRHAFKKARETRKEGRGLFTAANRVRFQIHIADIMLACAEEGQVGDYSRVRLLAASERAIGEAYDWELTCQKNGEEDRAAHAMLLLSEAKWMGLSRKVKERIAKIDEAQRIADSLDDALLLGRVEIAWGDEHAFQFAKRPSNRNRVRAEYHYDRAIKMLNDVEAQCLARTAQQRLERFRNPLSSQPPSGQQNNPGSSSPRSPRAPSPDFDPSRN